MESTIYKAVATVFVESSGIDWVTIIISVVAVLVAGFGSAIIGYIAVSKAAKTGAKATIEAAKKGADETLENSRKLEREKQKKVSRASLSIIYKQYKKYFKVIEGVYHLLNNNSTPKHTLDKPINEIGSVDIKNIVSLDFHLATPVFACSDVIEKFVVYVTSFNEPKSCDSSKWIKAKRDISPMYERFKEEFQKIEQYYKEHVEPELDTTH